MIKVTRINDTVLVVNADLIEFVEAIPDTIISLTTGKKIVVKETIDEVIARVASFKRIAAVRSLADPVSTTGTADHGSR